MTKKSTDLANEKIVSLRVHQSVVFNGAHVSTFSNMGSRGKSPANMTIMPEMQCVLVEDKSDRALVPFVNVAYMKLDSISQKQKEEAAAKEASKKPTVKASNIKRPR